MGYGDFTPASHAYKKPISKRELRKLQANYEMADEIAKKARELEQEEQKKASQEIDDLLGGLD